MVAIMVQTIRVLIADDHAVVRAGLRTLLETQGHFRVVAEAQTSQEAIRLAMEQRPDIVVLDIRMRVFRVLRHVGKSLTLCRVVV